MENYKEESTLEVWKQDRTGRFVLLNTYPIWKYSGKLGPKIAQGDRQAPEGFYDVALDQMNPNSSEYLAFNIGFPGNAFDQALLGEPEGFLTVHGGCRSVGCYAMTDAAMERDLRPCLRSLSPRRPGKRFRYKRFPSV